MKSGNRYLKRASAPVKLFERLRVKSILYASVVEIKRENGVNAFSTFSFNQRLLMSKNFRKKGSRLFKSICYNIFTNFPKKFDGGGGDRKEPGSHV